MKSYLFSPGADEAVKNITIPGWAQRFNERMGLPSSNGELYKDSVWARTCIDLRASALSGIPWAIRVGDDEEADFLENRHPLVRMLSDINDEMNWIDIIRATSKDLDIWGRAYWEKLGNGRLVTGLSRLNPATMKNIQTSAEGLVGFEQRLPNEGSRVTRFEREQIVYFHDYDPGEDFGGIGKIKTAEESIKADIAATEYLESFFRNGAIPAAIITTEQSVGEAELKRRQTLWRRWFGGVQKMFKTAFLDRGLKAEVLGFNLEQLALSEVRSEARKDICATFRVPPSVAGAWESATYNATPEQRRSFYEDSIFPDAEYVASVLNSELIRPHFDASFAFEWMVDELPFMQEDTNEKGAMLARAVEVGALTPAGFAALMDIGDEFIGEGNRPFAVPDLPQKAVELEEMEVRSRADDIKDVMAAVQKARPMLEKDEIGDVEADLNAWRRKALKRLADGKSASCTFDSKHIPDVLNVAVEELLKGSQDETDVHRVFHNAVLWREREPVYGA